MRLFKLTFIKRLLLALALSIFVVFSLTLIFWSVNDFKSDLGLISYLWSSLIDGAWIAFVLIAAGFFVLLSTINQFLMKITSVGKDFRLLLHV